MISNKRLFASAFACVVMLISATGILAQEMPKKDESMTKTDSMKDDGMKKDAMMNDDSMAMMADNRPVVAIIAADWCPYCKRIDPVVKDIMASYSEKMNFVVFDVTSDATSAAAKEKAEKLGLGEFFAQFKDKTSTVAVLKDKKVVYKTSNNGKRDDYVKAFEKALE